MTHSKADIFHEMTLQFRLPFLNVRYSMVVDIAGDGTILQLEKKFCLQVKKELIHGFLFL